MQQAVPARIIQGDALDVLRTLPDESVQCVVTSPPYFGLRDYGTAEWDGGAEDCDHAKPRTISSSTLRDDGREHIGTQEYEKTAQTVIPYRGDCGKCGATRIDRQLGLESTPAEYVDKMVAVFREVRRVLRKDGVAWVNMGDSYANNPASGGRGSSGLNAKRDEAGNLALDNKSQCITPRTTYQRPEGLKPKDLCGMPWRLAFALQQPYYTGQIKDERDRVWLAAIIDGEGCFFIHKRKAGAPSYSKFTRADGSEMNYTRTADTFGVGLEICNTNKAIIDRVQAIIPTGTLTSQSNAQNSRRKQTIYRWRVAPNEAKRIAQELYPHLVGKRHQARLLFSCPSTGDAGAAAHQAMMDLHNGIATAVDYPPPPSLFEPGWYLRQDVIWAKPAPMPESVTDRCTKSHEYIFLLSKSERYFYDAAAISEESIWAGKVVTLGDKSLSRGQATGANIAASGNGILDEVTVTDRRNKRSVWTITTEPYPEAHFATFPTELPRICILAGSKIGDTILDPFAGSGTTLQVALELSRAAIGIELNAEYVALANRRLNGTTLGLPLEIAA